MDGASNLYDLTFFDQNRHDALAAAQVIVPLLLELVHPASVVDVGCGAGAWLHVFRGRGVGLIRGLDGAYAQTLNMLIERDCFVPVDLSGDLRIPGHYDLALCLEVAEHLSQRRAGWLIDELAAAAPLVLFSAAIPAQGGTGHVNERWPGYWRALFAARGYQMLDPVRRKIRDDQRVKWWYRQNLVLFASEDAIRINQALTAEAGRPVEELEWVHVDLVKNPRFLLRTVRDEMWKRIRAGLHRQRKNNAAQ